ncbi:Vitamin B12 ABC transporter, permease protein BtuC [Olavius algarvensis associated proteobacterium Delta 3]|nr:Vitamin B12 ABC transporter, permease protein BtuC [Olavius algarvensis associated proteobacterium Delta 3]CAB5164405.1 Vitamin B12 ABC transporter, permease protein BtuC [Olavius algarvensis associated proteobacterium Delta 3]
MSKMRAHPLKRISITSGVLLLLLAGAILLGVSLGSTGYRVDSLVSALLGKDTADATIKTIIWQIRFPRALLAALVGAALSLGGLVFQALLRNPLAEPYILGVSGGSAVGAIIGIILGFSRFPGVGLTAFIGSMATLFLVLMLSSGSTILKKDSLLLAGVMVNAFCSAVIIFLLSLAQHSKLHNIIFWLMGDLSMAGMGPVARLAAMLFPCFVLIFWLSHSMNVLLMGKESAVTMGVNIRATMLTLLVTTSFMVSATVSLCGLLGFVGLVMPHLLRLTLGPDHRVLVPACILGGGAFMVLCDVLARVLPKQGEMPVGVITAMLGAPLFIYLLKRNGHRSRYERR